MADDYTEVTLSESHDDNVETHTTRHPRGGAASAVIAEVLQPRNLAASDSVLRDLAKAIEHQTYLSLLNDLEGARLDAATAFCDAALAYIEFLDTRANQLMKEGTDA